MPRRFNENQTHIIRQRLANFALEKIREAGVRKTTVESLARAAKISTGAFYKFYPSKEILFFEVYEMMEDQLKIDFMHALDSVLPGDVHNLKQAILTLLESETMQRLISIIRKDELDYLMMSLDQETIQRHRQGDLDFLEEVRARLQRTGFHITNDTALAVAYLQALFTLYYDKENLEPYACRVLSSFIDAMLAELCLPLPGKSNV